ncbi:MAG: hypothetical protein V4678_00900 [Patescibacteria group bacterium]
MNNHVAFFGTGQCDPNKGLIETATVLGITVGWLLLSLLIRKIAKSSKSKSVKMIMIAAIVVAGLVCTILVGGFTWLGLACSRY